MSPSLKYLMVSSIAARNASSDPMSLTATLGVELACVLLVMCGLAPDADREVLDTPQTVHLTMTRRTYRNQHGPTTARPAAARMINDMESVTTTERTRTRRSVQHMRAEPKGQSSPATIRPRYRLRQVVFGTSGVGRTVVGRSVAGRSVAGRSVAGRVSGWEVRGWEVRGWADGGWEVRGWADGGREGQGLGGRWLGGSGLGDQWASTAHSGAQPRPCGREEQSSEIARPAGAFGPPAA